MKSSFINLLFFISFSSACYAQTNKVGNGGNGVFCSNSTTPSSKLLDFYESKINIPIKENNAYVVANNYINKLEKIAPKLHSIYQKRLSEIQNEIEFESDAKLVPISDSKHLIMPIATECEILQVAIRKARVIKNEKRFLIQKDLWDKLSVVDQAGLLTHEIIYEHFSRPGDEDSINTRKINSFLYSPELSEKGFWSLIKELQIPVYP